MELKRISHAIYDTKHHLVWTSKYRKWILREDLRERTKKIFEEIAINHDFEINIHIPYGRAFAKYPSPGICGPLFTVCRYYHKSKKSVCYSVNCILKNTIKTILFARNFNDVEDVFRRLLGPRSRFKASYHRKISKALERHFYLLFVYSHNPFLVRDNNVTENRIKQLKSKLKQSGGFKTVKSAHRFLKHWFIYY